MGLVYIDQETLMRVSLRDKFAEPGEKFFLGADQGGRDILGQLIIGARNSIDNCNFDYDYNRDYSVLLLV